MSDQDPTTAGSSLPQPFATVIVPVKDGLDRLVLCVDALLEQDYPSDRYEVIVVDNGSAVSPEGALPDDPRLILLSEPTPGSYSARNAGLARAAGEIIAFTDADCVPASDWLMAAARFLFLEQSVDMVGGQVVLSYQHGQPVSGPEWFECVEGFPQQRYVRNGFAVTANMVTRRSVFDRIGLFDGTLQSGGDAEWGRRVRDNGGRQEYLEAAVVQHPARDTWHELRSKTVRTTGGVIRRTLKSNHPRLALLRLLGGQLYRSAAVAISVWREPRLPSFSARRKYLITRWQVDMVIGATLIRALGASVHGSSPSDPQVGSAPI